MLWGKQKERGEEEFEHTESIHEPVLETRLLFAPSKNSKYQLIDRYGVDGTLPWSSEELIEMLGDKDAIEEIRDYLKDTYGGGYYIIRVRDVTTNKLLRNTRIAIPPEEEPIVLGVDRWIIYAKPDRGGKYIKTDLEYSEFPTKDRVIEDIGGGGLFLVKAIDGHGRVLYTLKYEALDVPPPDWLVKKFKGEEDIKTKVMKKVEDKIDTVINNAIEELFGSGKPKGKGDDLTEMASKIEKLVKEVGIDALNQVLDVMEKSIEIQNKALEVRKKIEGGKSKDESKSFFDLLFKDAFEQKMRMVDTIISEAAKRSPEEALELYFEVVNTLPDASAALVHLLDGVSIFLSGLGVYLHKKVGVNIPFGFSEERRGRMIKREVKKEKEGVKKKGEEVKSSEGIKLNIIKREGGFTAKVEV